MKTLTDYQTGQVLLIDKPLEWTSFQVVNKLRWEIRQKFNIKKIKVGHAGTLDPKATGLLIICTGKFTKKINEYQGQAKEYTGVITIGATRPSCDMETEIDQTFDFSTIKKDQIHETVNQFLGEIDQVPPIFSAIKKDGVRLYELARKGETTEIKSRKITIYEFEITQIQLPNISFRIKCSKGTYIRAIARDFGKALGNGAYLSELRRTKIGDFTVTEAQNITEFISSLKD